MLKNLSPKHHMMVVAGGAFLILVLIILLGLRPQFTKLASLGTEQASELVKLEEANMKLERLDSIREEAAEIEAARVVLSRRLPDDAELPSLIVELQRVANDAALDFGAVKVDDVVSMQGYSEVPFSLTVTGTFYSFIDYLYRLEKMTREVVVDSFQLEAQNYPELRAEVKARVFEANDAGIQLPPPGESTQTGAGATP